METAGLIKKEFDSSNLRIKKMYITDKGEKMLENGKIIFDEVDDIMFKGISDEEINQLNMLIDKVNKNISAYSPDLDENICRGNLMKNKNGKAECAMKKKLMLFALMLYRHIICRVYAAADNHEDVGENQSEWTEQLDRGLVAVPTQNGVYLLASAS